MNQSDDIIFQLIEDNTSSAKLFYNSKTKCHWYIHPKTGKWLVEYYGNKFLWYNKEIFDQIFKYISSSYPEYEKFIVNWSEKKFKIKPKNIWVKQMDRKFEIDEIFSYICD